MHGGVDGYTRLPVYLRAGTKNTADTVLGLFQQAVAECGLPSRVRSDRGGENVEVSMYMLQHPQRSPGRGSMITGRSVHNQRIERLCRDIFEGVLYIYIIISFTILKSVALLTQLTSSTYMVCITPMYHVLTSTLTLGEKGT